MELTIDRYRGKLDEFLDNTDKYEHYLDEELGQEKTEFSK